jgi:transposase InsO family protein
MQVLREVIRREFQASGCCYGYRRIHGGITRDGTVVSEKAVLRIMAEDGLRVVAKNSRRHGSCKGELAPEAEDVIDRDFHADAPNERWTGDVTEFSIPAGKACLSPVTGCFDGMALSWEIGASPNAELVNNMLDGAAGTLGEGEHPTLHSDRGARYRWPGWIRRMEAAGPARSMSATGLFA